MMAAHQPFSDAASSAAGNEAISGVAWRSAILKIGRLQLGDSVLVHEWQFGAQVELVKACRIVAEDRALDRAIGRPERYKAMFLLHVLRDLEPAECLDLPL